MTYKTALAKTCLPLACAIAFTAACGGMEPESSNHFTRSSELDSPNGQSLNGQSLNGQSLNGQSLNGQSLNGQSLNGATLNGQSLNGVSLNQTVMSGLEFFYPIFGTAFTGSLWVGELSGGGTVTLRIDAITPLPAPNSALYGYAVSYSTSTGYQRLCGDEADGTPVLAIPMSGTWNYGANVSGAGTYNPYASGFTFACRHHAIAKCVEMGYYPWNSYKYGNKDFLTTCTRVLRADYCGNGVSYTVDGTLIDLFDGVGIQEDTDPTWPIESAWNSSGSTCVTPNVQGRFLNTGMYPPCLNPDPTCGEKFTGNVLMVDRYLYPTP